MTTFHPYELAEQQLSEIPKNCSLILLDKEAMVPGHKDYVHFQEFWNDPCWGGPIDW